MASGSAEAKRKTYTKYHEDWLFQFLSRYHDGEAQCIVCKKHTICKKFNVQRHYKVYHSYAYENVTGEDRMKLINKLSRPSETGKSSRHPGHEKRLQASYEIAHKMVLENLPFSAGDFIKDRIEIATTILSPHDAELYKGIHMSRNTVATRVLELAEDSKAQLRDICKDFVAFSIAADESTDIADTAQLVVFVRGVNSSLHVTEEFLDMTELETTTTGLDIFNAVVKSVDNMGLCWDKLVSVATDGAPAMTGRESGFVGRLSSEMLSKHNRSVIAIHCLIHQEALCGKALKMNHVMDIVTKVVNYIRAHGLSHRLFKDYLEMIDSELKDVPYYCEVRWLSRGETLRRFFELREHIVAFLAEKGKDIPEIGDADWISDLAFMADITDHLNKLNLQLQGSCHLIINMKEVVDEFKTKLVLWRKQIVNKDFHHFPNLGSLLTIADTEKYDRSLSNILDEFNSRFQDLDIIKNKLDLFAAPFLVNPDDVPHHLQLELIDLHCNTLLQQTFKEKGLQEFYQALDSSCFPKLRKFAAEVMTMFGSTYRCEQFFSQMNINKTMRRSRLTDSHLQAIMRLVSSKTVHPNIERIMSQKCHSSKQN